MNVWVNCQVSEDERRRMDTIARQVGISRSTVMRWAVKVLLERLGSHHDETLLLMSAPGERTLEPVAEEAN